MSRRKTAGFPGEKKIWKSTRILQRRARELLKARVYLREKEGVSTARRYRRHGGIEGQKEFSKDIRRNPKARKKSGKRSCLDDEKDFKERTIFSKRRGGL